MRLFALFGGLIVTILLAALIGPYFIDWSDYRGRFEQAASAILRQPVRVAGSASARLLPFPSLTLTDVRVGPDEVPLMVAKQFSLDAELAPFLSGEFLIFDMRIEDPIVTLDVDADGKPVWPDHDPISPLIATEVIRDVTVEKATVTGGQALIRDAARDRQVRVSDIVMTVGVDSIKGPIRADGTARVEGIPITMNGATGLLAQDGFALRTQTEWQGRDIVVSTQGRINRLDEGRTEYDGAFQLKPSGDEPGWTSEGVFLADATGVVIDQYRALFGDQADPYIVEGNASLDATSDAQFSLTARGNQFNVEKQVASASEAASRDRMSEIAKVLARFPVPPIPGTVELNLPAVVIGDTTIRDVRLDAKPSERTADLGASWDIEAASAQLPGRTVIEASGRVTLGELPEYSGHVVVASRQPSGLAAWLGVTGDERITALARAGMEADVTATTLSQSARNVQMALDSAVFTGEMERRVTSSRPLVSLNLLGRNVDDASLNAVTAMLRGRDGKSGIAASHDVDLTLNMEGPRYAGLDATDASIIARVRPGRTDFDRISIDGLDGGSISATAVVRSGTGPASTDFDVSAIAAEGAPFLASLARSAGFARFADEVATIAIADDAAFDGLSLTVKGTHENADGDQPAQSVVSVTGELGGSSIVGEVAVAGDRETFSGLPLTVDASIQNDKAARLLAQLGRVALANAPLGSGELTLRVNGVPSAEMETVVSARGGRAALDFDGTTGFEGTAMRAKGAVRFSGEDVRPFVETVGMPMGDEAITADLRTTIEMSDDGAISLPDLVGTVDGSQVTADLSWKPEAVSAKTGTLSGKFRVASLSLDRAMSAFLGQEQLPERDTIIGDPLAESIGLFLDIEADRVALGPFLLLEQATMSVRRDGRQLSFSDVSGQFMGGTARSRLSLQNDGETVLANGQVSLDRISLGRLLPSHAGTLGGITSTSFSFSANGRSLNGLIGSVTGSGSLSTGEVTVTGLDAEALPGLVQAADAVGFEITPEQTADLARSMLLTGETTFLPVQIPINMTNGTVRVSNLVANTAGATARVSGDLDLGTWVASSRSVVDFGAEQLQQSGVGPSVTVTRDGDSVETDMQPLVAFITQRALEREQARIEALQARLLERQRLRRDLRFAKYERQARLDAEEAERARQEAERIEAEARAAEEAARQAELEAEAERQRRSKEDVPPQPIVVPRNQEPIRQTF